MLERTALDVDAGTTIFSHVGHEVLRYCSRLPCFLAIYARNHRHLDKVVRLDLDQRLLVKEVFEVTVNQVESRGVSVITPNRIECVQVEKHPMSLHVRKFNGKHEVLVCPIEERGLLEEFSMLGLPRTRACT